VVVFNPLNIAREDLVEASVEFPGGMPKAAHVTGPGGREVPAQILGGKVLFLRRSRRQATRSMMCSQTQRPRPSRLRVSNDSLEMNTIA